MSRGVRSSRAGSAWLARVVCLRSLTSREVVKGSAGGAGLLGERMTSGFRVGRPALFSALFHLAVSRLVSSIRSFAASRRKMCNSCCRLPLTACVRPRNGWVLCWFVRIFSSSEDYLYRYEMEGSVGLQAPRAESRDGWGARNPANHPSLRRSALRHVNLPSQVLMILGNGATGWARQLGGFSSLGRSANTAYST